MCKEYEDEIARLLQEMADQEPAIVLAPGPRHVACNQDTPIVETNLSGGSRVVPGSFVASDRVRGWYRRIGAVPFK